MRIDAEALLMRLRERVSFWSGQSARHGDMQSMNCLMESRHWQSVVLGMLEDAKEEAACG